MSELFQSGLHEFIEGLQGQFNQIDRAIYQTYFDIQTLSERAQTELAEPEHEHVLEDILISSF
jgi:uncharacterized alpha-E superfamily protein